MTLTSEQLTRDLGKIDNLIALLCALDDMDEEDVRDLGWLRATRHSLCALLAARRAEASKKIVRLGFWRESYARQSVPSEHLSRIA